MGVPLMIHVNTFFHYKPSSELEVSPFQESPIELVIQHIATASYTLHQSFAWGVILGTT